MALTGHDRFLVRADLKLGSNCYNLEWRFQIYRLRRLFLFVCLQLQPNHVAFKALQMKGNFASLLTVSLGIVTCQANIYNENMHSGFICYQKFPNKIQKLLIYGNHSISTYISPELCLKEHPLFRFIGGGGVQIKPGFVMNFLENEDIKPIEIYRRLQARYSDETFSRSRTSEQ